MEKKTDCLLTSGTFFLTFKKILTVVKKNPTDHVPLEAMNIELSRQESVSRL